MVKSLRVVVVVEPNYRVTPTWVEVGLDWIELKLGWMLGWVVTKTFSNKSFKITILTSMLKITIVSHVNKC